MAEEFRLKQDYIPRKQSAREQACSARHASATADEQAGRLIDRFNTAHNRRTPVKLIIIVFLILIASTLVPVLAEAQHIYMCRDAFGKATFQQIVCGPGQTEVFRGNYARNLSPEDVHKRQERLRRAVEGRSGVQRNARR